MNQPVSVGRILGIDPGLNTTGYGLIENSRGTFSVIEAGVVKSRPRDPLELRISSIYEGIREILEAFSPTVVALEELYAHAQFPTTAIIMGHARGVICLAAAQAKIPVCHYPATQVKSLLVGNGRAPKSQVQLAVTHHLGLAEIPDPPDVADALAIALCHYYQSQSPLSSL